MMMDISGLNYGNERKESQKESVSRMMVMKMYRNDNVV